MIATDLKLDVSLGERLVASSSSVFASHVRGTGGADGRTPIYEVLKSSTRYQELDPATSAFDFALGETFGYDEYGCLTVHATLGYVAPSTERPLFPADVVYRHASYLNAVRADGWALGYVQYSKVSANASDADATDTLARSAT